MNEKRPRRFSTDQRVALYLAEDGRCAECGCDLEPGWHADHVYPWSRGGITDVTNGQALCENCNIGKGASVAFELRGWQVDAAKRFERCENRDFLCVATPGAGKTAFAAVCARMLLAQRGFHRLIIVVPSTNLRSQWAEKMHEFGIDVDSGWTNDVGAWPDFQGISVTYAAVASQPALFRRHCGTHKTLVILDEVHHCGRERAYGEAIRNAFEPAAMRLLLSGTPFRGDGTEIPFVRYSDGDSVHDFTYGYKEALRDKVCRPVEFMRRGGRMTWLQRGGETVQATFDDDLDDQKVSRRLRTALDAGGGWLSQVVREANECLTQLRRDDLNAGGLVVAMDAPHARAVAERMRRELGITSVLAISDEENAHEAIESFKVGSAPWIVAIKMVSEGVDIPRIRVVVYATNVVADLAFRQIIGRAVRYESDEPGQYAVAFIPDDERIKDLAKKIHDQVVGWANMEDDEGDPTQSQRILDGSLFQSFVPLSSSAEDRGAIGHGHELSAEEVAEARQFMEELGMNQSIVFAARLVRLVRSKDGAAHPSETITRTQSETVVKARRMEGLRTQNNKLAVRIADRTCQPHSHVNHELNTRCGIRSVKVATEEQLVRRVKIAEEWLARI